MKTTQIFPLMMSPSPQAAHVSMWLPQSHAIPSFHSSSSDPLPCLPDHAALPHRSNRLHDDDVVDIGATQTLEPKAPAAPKQRHKKSASSSKSDMHHFNKKRTFSLKECVPHSRTPPEPVHHVVQIATIDPFMVPNYPQTTVC